MTYLWIGIGGALGSIARAWMAVAVARITGPQFPWGTILINILGSFVIGFFGTLTANDSRFAVATDLRAFVMIGICGGFTTFSSFSLQTLDLIRDGRVGQAAGNVGLSVVLCLLAVSAGYASAAGIHRTSPRAAVRSGQDIAVVLLNRPDQVPMLLDAGARLLSGGELRALIMRTPATALLPSEEVMTTGRAADLRADQDNVAAALRGAVQAWAGPSGQPRVQATVREVEGDPADLIAAHAADARVIVVVRPCQQDGEHVIRAVHAALFETGRPVLVVPPSATGGFGRVIAIAWRNDAGVEAAVRDSLPLLRNAEAVHVLCAAASGEVPPLLQQAGITASLHQVLDGSAPAGDRLLAAAHDLGADLLVMGAFAHGEWREGVFGGVTRTMLAGADVPLFMRH